MGNGSSHQRSAPVNVVHLSTPPSSRRGSRAAVFAQEWHEKDKNGNTNAHAYSSLGRRVTSCSLEHEDSVEDMRELNDQFNSLTEDANADFFGGTIGGYTDVGFTEILMDDDDPHAIVKDENSVVVLHCEGIDGQYQFPDNISSVTVGFLTRTSYGSAMQNGMRITTQTPREVSLVLSAWKRQFDDSFCIIVVGQQNQREQYNIHAPCTHNYIFFTPIVEIQRPVMIDGVKKIDTKIMHNRFVILSSDDGNPGRYDVFIHGSYPEWVKSKAVRFTSPAENQEKVVGVDRLKLIHNEIK